MATAPLLAVMLILILKIIKFEDVYEAMTGKLKPYEIIILFQSLSYLCISVDQTGIFKASALYFVQKSGSSYYKLFLLIFFQSSLLTIFTSNDIVVLTLTPIICHLSSETNIDPKPLLFAQFFAANTWSIIFYVSNPTNLIVAQAFNLTFFSYLQLMILPTILAGVSLLFCLIFLFRSKITQTITPNNQIVDWSNVIPSKTHCALSLASLFLCLMLLVFAPYFGISACIVTLVFGTISFLVDVYFDFCRTSFPFEPIEATSTRRSTLIKVIEKGFVAIKRRFPTVYAVTARLPWGMIPFVSGMFVLVQALMVVGFTSNAAGALASACNSNISTAFIITFLSVLLCNVLNNQPMTILMTSIIQHPSFVSNLQGGSDALRIAMGAVVVGSNLGANLTLVGALAGILWRSILVRYEIDITLKEFIMTGCICVVVTGTLACFGLII